MRIPKKTHELIRQNEQIVKKSQKQDVNLQKNSVLYFQIGLIVCLLAVYGLLEMRFETVNNTVAVLTTEEDYFADAPVETFKPYEEPKEVVKQEPITKKIAVLIDPIIVDDNTKILDALDIKKQENNTTNQVILNPNDLDDPEPIEDDLIVDFVSVSQVPIYPGCENKKTNSQRRKCMSEKLTKLIQRKFRAEIAGDLGLSGIQSIQTQFTIDKAGHITDIKTSARHPKLESEAARVIKSIPEMQPGKQRDKAVRVRYTLPIKFQVEN